MDRLSGSKGSTETDWNKLRCLYDVQLIDFRITCCIEQRRGSIYNLETGQKLTITKSSWRPGIPSCILQYASGIDLMELRM